MLKYLFPILIFLIGQVPGFAQSERILNYHTDITINDDRSISVVETIDVYANGNIIKRGLTRSLPTRRNFNDRSMSMDYQITEVLKDGIEEPYFTQSNNGNNTLYIGRKEVILEPGNYQYTIKYSVPNQIGFFDDYDEIYWNAVGNDVLFPVEKASCTIRLPDGVDMVQESAYIGRYGESERTYDMHLEGDNLIFEAIRPLQPREGFTVALGFEKGFLKAPNLFQRYGTLLAVILGLFLLIPYYVTTWIRYGEDPETPPSYPLWDAPDGLSPASLNYIRRGSYQQSNFTASIIHLAIQGYLKIEEQEKSGFFGSKSFSLIKLKESDDNIPTEERRLMDGLFSYKTEVHIDGEYDSDISSTYGNHRTNLRSQHSGFINEGNNTHLLWTPLLITLGVGILAVIILANSPYAAWINIHAIIIFGIVAIVGLLLYIWLIKKPTEEKLDLRSRIKGFKLYLEMTEKDRLNLLNPPDLTPSHFEAILPYAFALGVEHKWSKKFEDILAQMNYEPQWHNSRSPVMFYGNFGNSFGSTLSGTTTQPSQSGSGSGGGGFSGGGGGGGGVGGW